MANEYMLIRMGDGMLAPGVRRVADNAYIPESMDNADWRKYQEWLAAGNTPDPVPPPSRPEPQTPEHIQVADPENDMDAVNRRYMNARLEELEHRLDELEEVAGRR